MSSKIFVEPLLENHRRLIDRRLILVASGCGRGTGRRRGRRTDHHLDAVEHLVDEVGDLLRRDGLVQMRGERFHHCRTAASSGSTARS